MSPGFDSDVRVSSFDDWRVTGDFSDEPLADGHSSQVWTLEKRA